MILLYDFFEIDNLVAEDGLAKAVFIINKDHHIFNGHFPEQPVVPGVCMMQMIKEFLEQVTGQTLDIQRGDDLKFLAIIDPVKNNIISAEVKYAEPEEGMIAVVATLFKDEVIHFKFKGRFRKA